MQFQQLLYVDEYELYLMIFDNNIHIPDVIEHINTPHHPMLRLHDDENIRASNRFLARYDALFGAINPSMAPSKS